MSLVFQRLGSGGTYVFGGFAYPSAAYMTALTSKSSMTFW
jgi:hypothetical protein